MIPLVGWLGAIALALLTLASCPVAQAGASTITIASPLNEAITNNPAPSFSGRTEDLLDEVTLAIYSGTTAQGAPVRSLTVLPLLEETWSAGPVSLADGTYTAQATQTNLLTLEPVTSLPVTFTVDTAAPLVSLTPSLPSTNDSTPIFDGEAGIADGDSSTVVLHIYAGAAPAGSPIETVKVTRQGNTWSAGPLPALADGTYTVQAEQSDDAGNVGLSAPSTFAVDTVAPSVSLTAVPTPTKDPSPILSGDAGIASGDAGSVRLNVYAGPTASGAPVRSLEVLSTGGAWTAGPLVTLADGQYTAEAEQVDAAGNVGRSAPFTFTIDTTPPDITMTSPAQGVVTTGASQLVEGSAGTAEGDSKSITIELFAGSSVGAQPIEVVMVGVSGEHWSATLGGLSEGVYIVRCKQSDSAGNTGIGGPATFTIKASEPVKVNEPITVPKTTSPEPPPGESLTTTTPSPQVVSPSPEPAPVPPVASFTWFPLAPEVGQTVSLVSSSTDSSSPIATLAWGVGGSPLQLGGPVFTTSFATAGTHAVSLRVVGADGLASTATEEIPVSPPPVSLMQPFPVVRIAGTDTARGAKITLLTVDAPAGTRITVVCHGRGCPSRSVSRVVESPTGGPLLIEFHRFERALRAGAVIEIRVSGPGEIGKYTRFKIRRGKLPERSDSCLSPTLEPMSCPSS